MAVKLTAKQRKVLKGLEKGKSPREIAKSMKTGPNNVYGHMKKLRDLGYLSKDNEPTQGEGQEPEAKPDLPALPPLPGESGSEKLPLLTEPQADEVHNGYLTKEHAQISELLKESVGIADSRIVQITERIEEIAEITEKFTAEVRELSAEADSLLTRKDTIRASL